MKNKIFYGPHLFPWGPEPYIRSRSEEAHNKIKKTLVAAFDSSNPNSVLSKITKKFDISSESPVSLSFMNYGDMQLVYLATLEDSKKVTVLINQPHTPMGCVRKEFSNLQRLVEIDSRFVVEPFAHFAMEKTGHELYASEYVDEARCIAVNRKHGIFIPSPEYHFKKFNSRISSLVNSGMIALLVNYYDEQRGMGLAETQISGDDFILTRDFNKNNPTTIYPNMKLIAARNFIETPLDNYIDLLKKEFLLGTNRDDSIVLFGEIKVNTRSKLPMTPQEIKRGIESGLELRDQRK